ncbi:hypothetical protein Y695_02299 [Hydrogenophaga sp. T4]|nr:hypothetical protein Y695_02299 [Hydrogenophaga sp. T4]
MFSNLLWRWRISSVLATKKALGSIASLSWFTSVVNCDLPPQISRHSSSEVCTVTSLDASATQSAVVRTLEPISRPTSQQAPMKLSRRLLSASS